VPARHGSVLTAGEASSIVKTHEIIDYLLSQATLRFPAVIAAYFGRAADRWCSNFEAEGE
jgi:hypothetical protein